MTNNTPKKKSNKILLTLLLLVLIGSGVAYYFYQESKPIVIPENASIRYFLDGKEVKEEDLLVDTEYDREVTDLDTGKTRKDKITFYDRIEPTIALTSDGSFNVQLGTTNVSGLSITDNYDDSSKIKVDIEGVEFDKLGEYDAIITATDTSGNIKKVSAVAKVVSEDLIVDGKVAKRDFSRYTKLNLDSKTKPSDSKEQEQTNKNPKIPETITLDESNSKLGLRKDETAPELILNNDTNTMYVGNKSYDFEPLAYDNYGDVEISYDDSSVNFDKAGQYEVTVIATDKAGNSTTKVANLILKSKPVVTYTNTASSGGGSGSSSDGGSSSSEGSSSSSSSSSSGGSGVPGYEGMNCMTAALTFRGINKDDYILGLYNGSYANLGYTSDLQYGDLCFYSHRADGTPYPEGHVVVYIGGGQMFEGNYDGQGNARITSMRYDYDYVIRG